jgi:hypothetical protein
VQGSTGTVDTPIPRSWKRSGKGSAAEYRLYGLNGLLSEGRSGLYPHGALLPAPPSPDAPCGLPDGQMEVHLALAFGSSGWPAVSDQAS